MKCIIKNDMIMYKMWQINLIKVFRYLKKIV